MDIKDEDDLLYWLYKLKRNNNEEVYPKVSEVPKGKENVITPDIDLLKINESGNVKVIGYEVKFPKYSRKNNTFSLAEFYKGLGQSLCYFRHGVEYVVLVVGLFGAPQEKLDIVKKTKQNIKGTWDFLSIQIPFLKSYMNIDIHSQDEDAVHLYLIPQSSFSVYFDKEINYKHDSLLRRKFTYAKNWIKEMERKKE